MPNIAKGEDAATLLPEFSGNEAQRITVHIHVAPGTSDPFHLPGIGIVADLGIQFLCQFPEDPLHTFPFGGIHHNQGHPCHQIVSDF